MTITVARAIVPLASILGKLVGLDLNTKAVAHGYKFGHELLVDLRDVLYDQRLYTILIKHSEGVARLRPTLSRFETTR